MRTPGTRKTIHSDEDADYKSSTLLQLDAGLNQLLIEQAQAEGIKSRSEMIRHAICMYLVSTITRGTFCRGDTLDEAYKNMSHGQRKEINASVRRALGARGESYNEVPFDIDAYVNVSALEDILDDVNEEETKIIRTIIAGWYYRVSAFEMRDFHLQYDQDRINSLIAAADKKTFPFDREWTVKNIKEAIDQQRNKQ